MIPEQILNPKGCGWYDETKKIMPVCGNNKKNWLCLQCKNIQKAQIQTLLDEKKNELEFLESYRFLHDSLEIKEKIQELQKEIKVLEGLINEIAN